MKNNCDVSGLRTLCNGFYRGDGCDYWDGDESAEDGEYCDNYGHMACLSTAAIRAAIESEKNNEK